MPIAMAMRPTFLIMYWPSRFGTNGVVHMWSGMSTSGEQTMAMWTNNSAMTNRVALGTRNNMPMRHSISARIMNEMSKYSMPIVLVVSASASGEAGLSPTSFKKPK